MTLLSTDRKDVALSERSQDMHSGIFVCFSKLRWEGDNKVFEVGCSDIHKLAYLKLSRIYPPLYVYLVLYAENEKIHG